MAASMDELRASCTRSINGHGNRAPADLLAQIPVDLGADRYGKGGAVAVLEEEVRTVLGKPAAVFMPSGTMAQQIALRIHTQRRGCRTVAFHATSHVDLHEEQAYRHLHGLVPLIVGDARSLIETGDVRAIAEPVGAMLFELPQREIGGRLPEWADLEEQTAIVRERGAAVHLDGARIWECTPRYGKTPAEIAALFDSVYVSLYKGLGGIAGCVLAGDEEVIGEARVWRSRHGGTLFAMWPFAAAGLAGLRTRLPLMPRYYDRALAIADALRGVAGVEIVPDPPHTPMMHLHLRVGEDAFAAAIRELAETEGIWTWPDSSPADTPSIRIVELTVGDATMAFEPKEVAGIIDRLVQHSR